jgi:hypothetical protein
MLSSSGEMLSSGEKVVRFNGLAKIQVVEAKELRPTIWSKRFVVFQTLFRLFPEMFC